MPSEGRPVVVLNVNDSPAARYLVSRILRSVGWTVHEAETGMQALALACEIHPDVAVLDIRLPDLSGYEVCERLKADPATNAISVIQTSASFTSSHGKARGLDSGADAYLSQPFEAVELIAMVRALLRLRKSEAASREQARALADADRRKDEFLAMLAHELRNPLAVVLTAATLLERGIDDARRVEKLGGTIARQARHLARLVDELLDVSRITRNKIDLQQAPLDLCALVEQVIRSYGTRVAERGQTLDVVLPDEPLWTNGDATRIEQVLGNLVSNAMKYGAEHGRIRVVLERRPDTPDLATLSVHDDGVGLAPEDLDSIWELFHQVEPGLAHSQGGLGIGLTLVRRLVEMHGGRVAVASEGRGRGATFSVHLPLCAPEQAERQAAPQGDRPTRPLRILFVDDNVDSCDASRVYLESDGHAVDVAHDGQQALDLALAGRYDVAIVDIGLPVLDGYEVARRITAGMPNGRPYLIALTGYGRAEDRDAALGAGFDLHLVKPVDMDALESLLARLQPVQSARSA
jgi:signal transduction histidine kinase